MKKNTSLLYAIIIACLLPAYIQAKYGTMTKITNKTGESIGLIIISTSSAISAQYGLQILQLDNNKTIETSADQKVSSIVVNKYIKADTYGPSQFIAMQLNPTTIDIGKRSGFYQVTLK